MGDSEGLPEKTVEAVMPSSSSPALNAAPQAVRRSMPMALSITLGILGACLIGWFFYYLTWFLLLVYLSFIIATILEAPVHWLQKRGIRRGFGTLLLMFGGIAALAGTLYALINQLVLQFADLAANLEKLPATIRGYLDKLAERFPALSERLTAIDLKAAVSSGLPGWQSILQHAVGGFEILTYALVCFFIVMYMLMEGPDLLKAMRRLMPKGARLEATRVFEAMARAHRGWFLASSINVVSASILTATGLWLVGVPAVMALGILAGFGELVPNIGPFFGALPSLLVVLAVAPQKFWYVVLMFVVVQTIQGYTLSPLIMKIGVRLPVLALIVAAIVIGALFGPLGLAVAIPFTADLVVLWNYFNGVLERDSTEDSDSVNSEPSNRRQAPQTSGTWNLQSVEGHPSAPQGPGDSAGRSGHVPKL